MKTKLEELRDELRDFAKKVRNEEITHTHSEDIFWSGQLGIIADKLTALIESDKITLQDLNDRYGLNMDLEEMKRRNETGELPHKYHKKYIKVARILADVFAYVEAEKISQSKALELTTMILGKEINEMKPTDEEIEREACEHPLSRRIFMSGYRKKCGKCGAYL
jgi:hypothetical protein